MGMSEDGNSISQVRLEVCVCLCVSVIGLLRGRSCVAAVVASSLDVVLTFASLRIVLSCRS